MPKKIPTRNPVFTQLQDFASKVSCHRDLRLHMIAQPYDIFRRGAAGDHVWVEAVRDLETAKTRIIELSAETPGQYVVFNQRSGRMVSSGTVVASPTARTTASELHKDTQRRNESIKIESDTLWK
jgi:hypothetical protein